MLVFLGLQYLSLGVAKQRCACVAEACTKACSTGSRGSTKQRLALLAERVGRGDVLWLVEQWRLGRWSGPEGCNTITTMLCVTYQYPTDRGSKDIHNRAKSEDNIFLFTFYVWQAFSKKFNQLLPSHFDCCKVILQPIQTQFYIRVQIPFQLFENWLGTDWLTKCENTK